MLHRSHQVDNLNTVCSRNNPDLLNIYRIHLLDILARDMQVAADAGAAQEVFDFIRANWPYFLTEADYARMDSLLAQPGFIEEKMAENQRSFYSMASSFSAQTMHSLT